MSSVETMKRYCSCCDTTKDLLEFPKSKNKYLGFGHTCKACSKIVIDRCNKTEKSVIRAIYNSQRRNSKIRHNSEIGYTREVLECWLYKNGFKEIYDNWKKKGYKKFDKPSVDRIDDYKTYTIDNIQLVTFKENWEKSIKDKTEGKTNKQNKAVVGVYPDGREVEFYSIANASLKTGADRKNIIYCCDKKPKYKTAKGIVWRWR